MERNTNKMRFDVLDAMRYNKLQRARFCASLTVPSLLPPEGWTENDQLPQPFSSVASRGVTAMASRMLSALLPLNDMPFFKFELRNGVEPDVEVSNFLETLGQQVYTKLSNGNLRETIYQALQHLIVVGDVMIIMEDDMNFRTVRLDRYVVRRDAYGDIQEVIFVEYEVIPEEKDSMDTLVAADTTWEYGHKQGYRELYTKIVREGDMYYSTTEDSEGNILEQGTYTTLPFVILRYSSVSGENYGRAHCEDIIGDIKTLEGFTEGMINGIAAASVFWQGVDPTGITDIDDLAGAATGSFVASRPNEVFTISPANTINPQISSTMQGVEVLRREIGAAFLMNSASMPQGERVTATAVRMVGQELENVLGGAFSAIARDLMNPIVQRTVFIMAVNGEIDERLQSLFIEEGLLNVAIVTGLQALSRDSDLQKLMQLGEMVRNLPEQAMATFRYQEYGKALITALGFDANNWVKSDEEVQQEMMMQQQQQLNMQNQAASSQMINQAVTGGIAEAAMQDVEQSGGQQVQAAMQQMGIS